LAPCRGSCERRAPSRFAQCDKDRKGEISSRPTSRLARLAARNARTAVAPHPLPFLLTADRHRFPIFFQLFYDGSLERFQRSGPGYPSIDKDGGGASHPGSGAEPDILVDSRHAYGRFRVFFELLQIQTKFQGNLHNLDITQPVGIIDKPVVELPELPLSPGRKCCDCGLLGEWMFSEGKILEDELHLVGVFLEQLLEYRREPRTGRSLKASKYNYLHRCIGRALERRNGKIRVLDKRWCLWAAQISGEEIAAGESQDKGNDDIQHVDCIDSLHGQTSIPFFI